MTVWKKFLVIGVAGWISLQTVHAATEEERVWQAGEESFERKLYDEAEKFFTDLVQKYPASPRRSEGFLRQAQSRFHRARALREKNAASESTHLFRSAMEVLTTQLPYAGALTEQYQFWLGEIEFEQGHFETAAGYYHKVAHDFPASTNRVRAACWEAWSHLLRDQFDDVVRLLTSPDGDYLQAVKQLPADPSIPWGALLVADAQLNLGKFEEARATLINLSRQPLPPELTWRRLYLLCRVIIGQKDLPGALQNVADLKKAAEETGKPEFKIESHVLEAGILENLGRIPEAIKTLEGAPALRGHQAVLEIIRLYLSDGQLAKAREKVAAFLKQFPDDGNSDLLRLVAGELILRETFVSAGTNDVLEVATLPTATRNRLDEALGYFDALLSGGGTNRLSGKAYLNRGWTLWSLGRIPESAPAFSNAWKRLPFSEDQAVARLKLADAQFFQGDAAGAITHYQAILDDYQNLPRVQSGLADQALYQLVRANLKKGDAAAADLAFKKLIQIHPDNFFSDQSVLLMGQHYERVRNPASARERFLELSGKSALRPEIDLSIIRTYVMERNWPEALSRLETWRKDHGGHPLRPKADFERGFISYLARQEPQALQCFTNFVHDYEQHELAPQAQLWVADYYYRTSNFNDAERNYQKVFETWPSNELAYVARLRAGMTAYSRQSPEQAKTYVWNVIKSPSCPEPIRAQAYVQYGDLILNSLPKNDGDRKTELKNAIQSFLQATNAKGLAAGALGQAASCYLQLSQVDTNNSDVWLKEAESHFHAAADHPEASWNVQALATIGLGKVQVARSRLPNEATPAERAKRLEEGLHYFSKVFHEAIRGEGSGHMDPEYRRMAAHEAIRLYETLQKWAEARELCQNLADAIPASRHWAAQELASIEKRMKEDQPK